jgi:hypothetical protein
VGIAFAALVIFLVLTPAYSAGKGVSGAVDVVATRSGAGVLVRIAPFPMTRSVVVTSIGVSRALADEMGLEVPAGYRWALDNRWLSVEGRIRLKEPMDLFFAATRATTNPAAGLLRVVSHYRPGIGQRLRTEGREEGRGCMVEVVDPGAAMREKGCLC